MDNTKHTPGPWTLKLERDGIPPVIDSTTREICKVWNRLDRNKAEAIANARLIAAAPDMLDCLKGLIDEIERCGVKVSAELELLANQAIARVEGEL